VGRRRKWVVVVAAAVAIWSPRAAASNVLGYTLQVNERPLTLPDGVSRLDVGVFYQIGAHPCCGLPVSYDLGVTDRLEYGFPLVFRYRIPSGREPRVETTVFAGMTDARYNIDTHQFRLTTEIGARARFVVMPALALRGSGGVIWDKAFGSPPSSCPADPADPRPTCSFTRGELSPWTDLGVTIQASPHVAVTADAEVAPRLTAYVPSTFSTAGSLWISVAVNAWLDYRAGINRFYLIASDGASSGHTWFGADVILRW
jgi:hypothetical protein